MDSKPRFSKAQELANAISHGIALFMAIAATSIIIIFAVLRGDNWLVVSTSIFSSTLILLYFSSTMNHSLTSGKAKDFFHNFDQIAIYLLIAGTYTPLAISIIRHDWGWVMFGIEWGLAISGILVKAFIPNKFEKGVNIFVIISYVLMGWLLLLFLIPLFKNLTTISIILIFAGGLFYTFGIIFFKMDKLKFSHLIWHLMVIGGSVCHWLAIFLFVLQGNSNY
ncbi:MAG: hemolysin III family protein [Prolixibacteraceae bacterium]|jgi:hemolysin III|nr:hemolysin III family protein [Prolixibacteraceae bacterium]MBT6006365.1 hemolysin III family protein [Prolixibacteraceae bacterium]MBT6763369.1 hemolysin III family protein [Prolixibacteraceae bacterium]MBT6999979.1 hemolysin III family protein [Prolixibacteraceae bacterium]MBT7396547.1 hemolysin III family protein [Prolixibacteraceae bacterium]